MIKLIGNCNNNVFEINESVFSLNYTDSSTVLEDKVAILEDLDSDSSLLKNNIFNNYKPKHILYKINESANGVSKLLVSLDGTVQTNFKKNVISTDFLNKYSNLVSDTNLWSAKFLKDIFDKNTDLNQNFVKQSKSSTLIESKNYYLLDTTNPTLKAELGKSSEYVFGGMKQIGSFVSNNSQDEHQKLWLNNNSSTKTTEFNIGGEASTLHNKNIVFQAYQTGNTTLNLLNFTIKTDNFSLNNYLTVNANSVQTLIKSESSYLEIETDLLSVKSQILRFGSTIGLNFHAKFLDGSNNSKSDCYIQPYYNNSIPFNNNLTFSGYDNEINRTSSMDNFNVYAVSSTFFGNTHVAGNLTIDNLFSTNNLTNRIDIKENTYITKNLTVQGFTKVENSFSCDMICSGKSANTTDMFNKFQQYGGVINETPGDTDISLDRETTHPATMVLAVGIRKKDDQTQFIYSNSTLNNCFFTYTTFRTLGGHLVCRITTTDNSSQLLGQSIRIFVVEVHGGT